MAADIPARRIADLPVELEGGLGASIRDAERALAQRLVARYQSALAHRAPDAELVADGIDHALVRQVASASGADAKEASSRRERLQP